MNFYNIHVKKYKRALYTVKGVQVYKTFGSKTNQYTIWFKIYDFN